MKNSTLRIILISICLILLGFLIINDFKVPLDFDSSFNLNIVKNFVSKGIYGTSVYLVDGQKYYWFDPWITTGPSVLLPISLVVLLFRNIAFSSRIGMNVFFLSFLYILSLYISKYLHKIKIRWIFIINVAIAFIFSRYTSSILDLGIHTVGEIPGYTYIMIGLLCFLSDNVILAGLFLSFAILAKLQLLFLSGPLFLVFIFYYRRKFFGAIKLIAAFCIPLCVYGLSLLAVFGKHIRSYYGDFKGVAIMQKVYPSIHQLFDLKTRFLRWTNFDPLFFVLAVGFVIFGSFYIAKSQTEKNKLTIFAFTLFLGYFLFLWQFNTDRHLVLPKYLLICVYFYYFLSKCNKIGTKIIVFVVVFAAFLYSPQLIARQKTLQTQIDSARYIEKKYASATLYNIGWWKSPELQLFMNKDVIRVDKKNLNLCKKECYLLVSKYQAKKDPLSMREVKQWKQVEDKEYFSLYKIK